MIQKEVEELLRPAIEDMGYALWGCEYLPQGKYSLLRVYIDKADGIHITDCEKVSRRASAILDVSNPIHGNYTLEVSSPGIPRPLFHKEQYTPYIGQEVHIRLVKPLEGQRNFTGIIQSTNEEAVELIIGGESKLFLFSNILKANLTAE